MQMTNQRGKTTAWVYERMRDQIVAKRFAPGAKINQNEVAERLGISRTPVVNALHKLESEGLVDNVPHTGFFVHQITVKELLDLFALREALDTIVVTELVESIIATDLQRLESFFAPFSEKSPIDAEAYRTADIQFHLTMLELCTNTLAKRVNENFQVFSRSFMGGLLRPPEYTLPEHLAIVVGLRDRNLEAARQAVVRHNSGSKKVLQEMVINLRKIGVDPERIAVDEVELPAIDV
jgi:DNA-binding GntR family transcriptional regulator